MPEDDSAAGHGTSGDGESPQTPIARLEAPVRRVEDDKRRLGDRACILREVAAKHFDGQTN